MKKRCLCLMVLVSVLCSSFGLSYSVMAAEGGWLTNVQQADLNTTYSDSLSREDYVAYFFEDESEYQDDLLYDAYEIKVPAKGVISMHIESTNENYFKWTYYRLYKTNNPDKEVLLIKKFSDYDYSSARNTYYGTEEMSLSEGSYYIVMDDEARHAEGKTYSISFNYTPSISTTYISSASGKKGALNVIWNKVSDVDGYQLALSSSSSFAEGSTQTFKISSNSKSSAKIKNLYRKRYYYVRVRAYKSITISGETKTYYSAWSDSVSAKTK